MMVSKQEFLHLIEKHQRIIHKVCSIYRDTREDQEDLSQEIVLQLWKSFPAYRRQASVSTWMYRIALNTALASFRKRRPAVEFCENYPEPMQPPEATE